MNAFSRMREHNRTRFSLQGGVLLPAMIMLLLLVAMGMTGCKRGEDSVDEASPAPTASADVDVDVDADAIVDEDEIDETISQLSLDELHRAARNATTDNRIVTPPGNNAFEYYLSVLERVDSDSAATVALHELFPIATGAAEQEINKGELERATRIIELLTQADPDSYTLTILRSKRDAKRRQIDREEQLEMAAAEAAARPAPAPVQSEPETEPEQPRRAAVAEVPTPVATPAPAPAPAPTPAPPVGETRGVVMTSPMAPAYPQQALRDRVQGWVEVEFVVSDSGKVQNVRVVDAQPRRVFDRAAIQAVNDVSFLPELVGGQPVTSIERRRIEFKLGG